MVQNEEVQEKIEKIKHSGSTVLDLSRMSISSLPMAIFDLINLKVLDLSNNFIEDLKGLGELKMLVDLNLSNNMIEEVSEIEKLKELKWVNLSNNNIANIDSIITSSNQYEWIDVSDNRIENLDKDVLKLNLPLVWSSSNEKPGLKALFVKNNPIKSPIYEFIKSGQEVLESYYNAMELTGRSSLLEAKLILVGEGGVGKTSLRYLLQNENSQLPSINQSTHGLEVSNFSFKTSTDLDFRVNMWDFGGQEVYHGTHNLFYTPRSLYLLITDGRRQNTNIDYWLETIKTFGHNSPVMLIENRKSGHRNTSLNLFEYKKRFNNLHEESFSSNFLTKEGLPELVKNIQYQLEKLEGVREEIPFSWYQVRKLIEELSSQVPYIREEEFIKICEQCGLNYKQAIELSSDYLHPIGVFLHYRDNESLKDIIVLKNSWLTEAFYSILDDQVIAAKNYGEFTISDIDRIWSEYTYFEKNSILLEYMKHFELCYHIPSEQKYIIPQLLPISPIPDNSIEEVFPQVIYQYDYLPKGFFNRIIVRIHDTLNGDKEAWKGGIYIQNQENSKALVLEDTREKQVTIRVSGTNLKSTLRKTIVIVDSLNSSLLGLRVRKQIKCICQNCLTSKSPHYYHFKNLTKRLKSRKKTIECYNSFEELSVENFFKYIFGPNFKVPPTNIFISYAIEDLIFKNELVKHLSTLSRKKAIKILDVDSIKPGENVESQTMHLIQNSEIIIFMISSDFMNNESIMNIEVPFAFHLLNKKGVQIIPILIRPCNFDDTQFKSINFLPSKTKALNQYTNQDEAWEYIIREFKKII